MLTIFIVNFACVSKKGGEMADLALINGVVWTVNPEQPKAEAVAVKGDKIIKVGSTKEIKKLVGADSEIIDLKGDLMLPGFIDSHTHFLDGGFALMSVDLREARSKDEFVEKISEKALDLNNEGWILNGNWDHQQFSPPELPRKEWIDNITPHNPVCVKRHDGHMVLVNSLALRIAGITKNTPSPKGGEILKDSLTGEPTGILKDAAMNIVFKFIPEPSLEKKMKAAERSLKYAVENGVTSIHDMATFSNFKVYQELLKRSKLITRLTLYIQITENENFGILPQNKSSENSYLKLGGLKGFVDGSLGSSTALFFEPYTDDPSKSGLLSEHMFPEGIMEKRIDLADKAGLQVAIHAIGDKANHIILDIFENVIKQNGERDRRWRIEHAQHLLPEDIERMGKLGILASIQPYHAIDDGRWAEKKIGKERCRYTYAFKSLLDKGVRLACGSDWAVAPLVPISGIYAAVTRQTTDGKNPLGWIPEEKISLEEAIKGYTLNGAYADFSEKIKGSVEEGKLADLVVLSDNVFEIPADEIKDTYVKITIINGKIVYEKQ